jgi:hypothetical protein
MYLGDDLALSWMDLRSAGTRLLNDFQIYGTEKYFYDFRNIPKFKFEVDMISERSKESKSGHF